MSKILKQFLKITSLLLTFITCFTTSINANTVDSMDQVILVVGTSGYKATVSLYEKNSSEVWNKKISTNGYVGKNGITDNKREGDGKTPSGVYSLSTAFGVASNPGTSLNYRKITNNDYWVDDSNSKYYNKWVDITKVVKDWKSAEHLYSYKTAYKYGVVVNYNTQNIVPGKGSAIFLHNSTGGYTAGCVSVPENTLVSMLKILKPNAKIVIVKDANSIPKELENKSSINNKKGTINVNGLNIRKGPSTSYASITKVNKGQVVSLKEKNSNNWYKVQLPSGVVGWCNGKYLTNITDASPSKPPISNSNSIMKNKIATISTNGLNIRKGPSTSYATISVGNKDQVVLLKEKDSKNWYKVELPNGVVGWCNGKYLTNMKYFNEYCLPSMNQTQINTLIEKTIAVAINQLGKPYVWDTQGPNTFDCSGLMQYSFKNGSGIELTDYSAEQALKGKYIQKKELKRGDLVFFDVAKKGRVSHVGLYLGNGEFIEAASSKQGLKISKMSESKYSSNYITARRVIK